MKAIKNAREFDDPFNMDEFDEPSDYFEHKNVVVDHWIGAVIGVASLALNYLSSDDSADAASDAADDAAEQRRITAAHNAEISKYDAKVARHAAERERKKAERDAGLHFQKLERVLGAQQVGFANAGVITSTGSALDAQINSAVRGERDLQIILDNGLTNQQKMRSMEKRYRMQAKFGMSEGLSAAYQIEQAGNRQAENIKWEGYSQAASTIYNIGSSAGWWE